MAYQRGVYLGEGLNYKWPCCVVRGGRWFVGEKGSREPIRCSRDITKSVRDEDSSRELEFKSHELPLR